MGIDVGKASHHVCAVDDTGKVVFSQQTGEKNEAELTALEAELQDLFHP